MNSQDPKKPGTRSLVEDEIVSARKLGRRSSITMIGAGVSAVALVSGTAHAEDESELGCSGRSDSDPNDPAGCGRGRSGVTDRDPSDSAGNGRGVSGCSDSDPNDPGGNGRHCGRRSCSDSDPNDPAGRGRHC